MFEGMGEWGVRWAEWAEDCISSTGGKMSPEKMVVGVCCRVVNKVIKQLELGLLDGEICCKWGR